MMKSRLLNKIIAILALVFAFAVAASAQTGDSYEPKPGAFQVGDEVEVDMLGWHRGKIVEVKNDGYFYDIQELEAMPKGAPLMLLRSRHFKTVRPVTAHSSEPETKSNDGKLVLGKYGCISTTGSAYSGTYQIHPRGSVLLAAGGKYTYYGFEKPSLGTFKIGDKGVLLLKDGALDGGEMTPLGEGYENQFFLVYPTITDNRWKCKLVDE